MANTLSPLPTAEDIRHLSHADMGSGCILWDGTCNSHGYPIIYGGGQWWNVARLVYEWEHGMEAPKLRRSCGNRQCINGHHLLAPGEERTMCRHGHRLTPGNTLRYKGGIRCLRCCKAARERYNWRRREEENHPWRVA